jgi:hypothetical protein
MASSQKFLPPSHEAGQFLYVMFKKDKLMLAFHFMFDVLWTGGGSSVSSVTFLEFCELK